MADISSEDIIKHTFNSMLKDALKENLHLDIDFDQRSEELEIGVYFNDEKILNESVYLDHDHEEED